MRSSLLAFSTAVLASIGSPGASAQPSSGVPTVGIITPHSSPDAPPWRVFRAQLAKLGYIEGRTVHLVFSFADGDLARMSALATQMAQRKVDVLVTNGGVVPAAAIEVLVVMPDGALFHRRSELVSSIAGARLAAMYPEREYVDAGGLMSYGPVIMDNFRGTAEYVDKILRGMKVGDLPVQAPSRFEFILNQKLAQAQGLSWPEELLNRADEVIE